MTKRKKKKLTKAEEKAVEQFAERLAEILLTQVHNRRISRYLPSSPYARKE